jgi:peptidoglycan hydrolase-like protein with peptidoglycan-binding domain
LICSRPEAPTGTSATLSIGISGPAVKNLQDSLRALKLYEGDADGVYDQELADAVSLFQRLYGYTVSGKASGALQRDAAERVAKLKEQFGDAEYEVSITESSVNMARVKVSSSLNLRSAASTSSKILGKLKNGDEVVVLAKGSSWTKVLVGATEGYLKNSYLTFFTKRASSVEYTPTEPVVTDPGSTPDPNASKAISEMAPSSGK